MAQKKTNSKTTTKKTTKSRMTKEEKEAQKIKEEEEKEKLRKKSLLKSEIYAIIVITLGVFFTLSCFTNACGNVGHFLKAFLLGCFGKVGYILPICMIVSGILVFMQKTALLTWRLIICSFMFFVFLSSLFAVRVMPLSGAVDHYNFVIKEIPKMYQWGSTSGGVIGNAFGILLFNTVGKLGLYIITIVGMIIMLLFIIDTPLSELFDDLKLKRMARQLARAERQALIEEANEDEQLEIEKEKLQAQLKAIDEKKEAKKLSSKTLPTLDTNAIKQFEDASNNKEQTSSVNVDEIAFDENQEQDFEINTVQIDNMETGDSMTFLDIDGDGIPDNKRQILEYVQSDIFADRNISEDKFSEEEEEKEDILEKYAAKESAEDNSEEAGIKEEKKALEEGVQKTTSSSYKLPPIDLLHKGQTLRGGAKGPDMSDQARLIEDTLHSFGVSATVTNVIKGPAVTRFELTPAPGVLVSKITRLQDDLALNLRATSLRIEAPIPGKAAVGIEVSNDVKSVVTLRELIESKEFKNHKSKIAVTLGKSISGENIICDLHEMPHLLIAGTTGSGKSVCIDSMLVSLLYRAKPDEVKLMLIDPKIVELAPFNGIPHLVVPVVTEPNKAAVALAWAVNEMNNRYNKFAEEGVKDLLSFNESVKFKGENDRVMPEMVIVIDELADLIMASKNQVEDSICRLAQKARAAGMHLVIATQRPSTDVITGVIKANVPSRIALSVSSGVDSRVIIDMTGAENLLGKGDMLYDPQSLSKPIRVQGTMITDDELHAVIDYVKGQADADNYNEEVINEMAKVGSNNVGQTNEDTVDELFMDALETVVKAEQCSVSMLQRRFRIGYNRAARLVDMMEERGMVGPADGARPRKVNMTSEEFDEYVQRNKELDGEI